MEIAPDLQAEGLGVNSSVVIYYYLCDPVQIWRDFISTDHLSFLICKMRRLRFSKVLSSSKGNDLFSCKQIKSGLRIPAWGDGGWRMEDIAFLLYLSLKFCSWVFFSKWIISTFCNELKILQFHPFFSEEHPITYSAKTTITSISWTPLQTL